jgi:hypothetical protein
MNYCSLLDKATLEMLMWCRQFFCIVTDACRTAA